MVFGGIISHIAHVAGVPDESGRVRRLLATVSDALGSTVGVGDSVALNGVCLTVVTKEAAPGAALQGGGGNGGTGATVLAFDLSDETLARTTLAHPAARMHAEPALRFGESVGGHLISGHVHGVGSVVSLDPKTGEWLVRLPAAAQFPARPTYKDSIAIDGVSLTVAKLHADGETIAIALVPHTLQLTLFASMPPGTPVNVELNLATVQRAGALEPAPKKDDAFWMREAIKEGEKGRLTAPPNPWVGAVLVDASGVLRDSGFHRRPGSAHAEREITADMKGCTLYVTLEPCCHHGRTPPCVDWLVERAPARVVVGTLDPDPRVCGTGVQQLRDAGISVVVGVAEADVRASLRAYLWHRSHNATPYVVCKLALSQDSCYAYTTDSAEARQWITGEQARKHGHGERAASQRVVIGKNTDATDKPRLDVRYGFLVDRQPERVVSTRDLAWLKPRDEKVLQVLVEGGPELQDDLIRRRLVNEFVLYRSTKFLGQHGVRWNPSFVSSEWALVETVTFDDGDTMQRFVHRPWTPKAAHPAGDAAVGASAKAITAGAESNEASSAVNGGKSLAASAGALPSAGGVEEEEEELKFDSIEDALAALRKGNPIVVMDDESRENEGDLMLLADRLTLRNVKLLLDRTTGIVCATMTQARAAQLELPLMVPQRDNKDRHRTKFTLSVDAASGITTGVSAVDRLRTLSVLAQAGATPKDLVRPGHIFPLVAVAGGLLERRGHTEAGVELARMVGGCEHPVMVISELYDKGTGRMMTAMQCRQLGFPMIHIEALYQRLAKGALWASVPLQQHTGDWRIAVVAGCRVVACGVLDLFGSRHDGSKIPVVLRIHSECFTGDVLGSSLCDCGNQLHAAMREISRSVGGLIVFPAEQEGRGIGLAEKVKAYAMQRERCVDTFTANEALGHPRDVRNYDSVAFALKHVGILAATHRVELLSENPQKEAALRAAGYEVAVRALRCEPTQHNTQYLLDKRAEFAALSPVSAVPAPPASLLTTAVATAAAGHAPHASASAAAANKGGYPAELLVKTAPHAFPVTPAQREALGRVTVILVQSEWHRLLIDPLVELILRELREAYGITQSRIFLAGGSGELPGVIRHLAARRAAKGEMRADSPTVFIAIGALVNGDTDHYEMVAKATTANLQKLALDRELWIVNCVLTCQNMVHVADRCFERSPKCVGPHMAEAVARLALLSIEE